MITTRLFHKDSNTQTKGGIELLDQWGDDNTSLWLNIEGPLDDETAIILNKRLGLHFLALQDAARDRHPPKIEDYDDHTFLIFKGLSAESETIDCKTIQISLFVGEKFLVTRHSGPSRSIKRLGDDLDADPKLFKEGTGALAVRIGRVMVDRYLKILLDLEPRLETLEERLMGDAGDEVLGELVAHKSDLTRLQRFFHYHTHITHSLTQTLHPGFLPAQRHGLIDVYEQQERVGSLCALYYQLAADLIEGYISLSSHRLNGIMRVLTIITAIFVPLSFLAGVYGMNFEYIPELKFGWGYFILLGTMALIAGTLLYVFHRKRWFG